MAERDSASVVEPVTADTLDARENEALVVLGEIIEASGLELRAEPRGRHAPYLDVELVGPDAAESFGRQGHSLDALQYLANLIIGRRIGPDIRVILDADSYRARRTEKLIQLASEYAAEVKERQEECEFEPMAAHERRIIHNALSSDPSIRTYSEGDDPHRRVIIAPR